MITIILISAIVYVSVGVVMSLAIYVYSKGYRDEDKVVVDCFLWPMIILGAGVIATVPFVKWVGDWILARGAKAE